VECGGTLPSHLAIPEPVNTAVLLALQEQLAGVHWIRTTWHFPCLCTRAVSWADQALPDRTWNSWCLELHLPGRYQNCTFWVVLEFV